MYKREVSKQSSRENNFRSLDHELRQSQVEKWRQLSHSTRLFLQWFFRVWLQPTLREVDVKRPVLFVVEWNHLVFLGYSHPSHPPISFFFYAPAREVKLSVGIGIWDLIYFVTGLPVPLWVLPGWIVRIESELHYPNVVFNIKTWYTLILSLILKKWTVDVYFLLYNWPVVMFLI